MPLRTADYDAPNRVARGVNGVIRRLAELGIPIAGTAALRIRGRRTGAYRAVVINLLTVDGVHYLVSPRGNTQWARNARAAGVGEIGPRWRRTPVAITEVTDDAKTDLLRRYLARWHWQVKGHVAGLTRHPSEQQLRAAAPSIPVFTVTATR